MSPIASTSPRSDFQCLNDGPEHKGHRGKAKIASREGVDFVAVHGLTDVHPDNLPALLEQSIIKKADTVLVILVEQAPQIFEGRLEWVLDLINSEEGIPSQEGVRPLVLQEVVRLLLLTEHLQWACSENDCICLQPPKAKGNQVHGHFEDCDHSRVAAVWEWQPPEESGYATAATANDQISERVENDRSRDSFVAPTAEGSELDALRRRIDNPAAFMDAIEQRERDLMAMCGLAGVPCGRSAAMRSSIGYVSLDRGVAQVTYGSTSAVSNMKYARKLLTRLDAIYTPCSGD